MQLNKLILGACLAFLTFSAHAALLVGKVVGVTVGDTIRELVDSHSVKVRLACIDTPEKHQPYGSRAK